MIIFHDTVDVDTNVMVVQLLVCSGWDTRDSNALWHCAPTIRSMVYEADNMRYCDASSN